MKIGVLIIGSLIWDNEDDRKPWRDERLDIDAQQKVETHTRYGRISGGRRHHTYTMVFSRTAEPSTAIVAPCKRLAKRADAVFEEARWLAKAEVLGSNGRWYSFGAVGAIANPKSAKATHMLGEWPRYFNRHVNGDCQVMTASPNGEKPGLTEDGFLNVEWPRNCGSNLPNDCDILLATANAPEASYPNAIQIAEKMLEKRYAEYFVNNVLCGILTADDVEVWRCIMDEDPDWIPEDDKRRVSEILLGTAQGR